MTAPGAQPRPPFLFLTLTAVLCGAFVMVIEVLGARVIGPFFGVSLFVWTSLITVTLVALAAGYAAGGIWADRWNSADALYFIVLLAGLAVLWVPFIKTPVLKACAGLGLRGGSLLAAAMLFGPALFLLGCVSPFIVKLAFREQARLGRTVGLLYALSTAGSFAGTVSTGFFLIAWLGVDRIFHLTAALLIGLAAAHFVFFGRRALAVALLAIPLIAQPQAGPTTRVQRDGTVASLVHKRDSFYGSLRVIDYRFGEKHTREMAIDGLVQGGIDLRSGASVYEYSYLLGWLPVAFRPDGRDCLVIGLGLGAVPRWFAARGIRTEAVEIDPAVVDITTRYVGPLGIDRMHTADARQFLSQPGPAFDYIILDAFTGDAAPAHLLTVEALRQVRGRLKPGGVVALNLHGSFAPQRRAMTLAVLRTVQAVFADLRVYAAYDRAVPEAFGNVIVVAGERLPAQPDLRFVTREFVHPLAAAQVHASLLQPVALPSLADALILTDDYNPIDILDLELKEAVRRGVLENTDWDLLLG